MAGYSPTIADFDNDGWKDIFITRGHVESLAYTRSQVAQPNTVFRNQGGSTFRALTAEAGLTAQPPSRHRGSAVGDLNGDGRLDVVVSALSAPAEIWINDSPGGNHWLEFKLEGTKSNRDGIGARIKVVAGGLTQYNHVCFTVGYASSSAGPTHFGLGANKAADRVEIRWPSGITQGAQERTGRSDCQSERTAQVAGRDRGHFQQGRLSVVGFQIKKILRRFWANGLRMTPSYPCRKRTGQKSR